MDKIPFVIQLHGIPSGVLPGFLLPSYHSCHPGTQRRHQYAFCVFEIYLYTNRGVLASLHNQTSHKDERTPWLHEQTIAHLSSTWKIILNFQNWHFLIYFLHKSIPFPVALSECVFFSPRISGRFAPKGSQRTWPTRSFTAPTSKIKICMAKFHVVKKTLTQTWKSCQQKTWKGH